VRTAAGQRALRSFDAALREPDNALNPGTTADVVTATLFVALLEGIL
jgi:triphosphoribosyl-dephospho-CoA synthetase